MATTYYGYAYYGYTYYGYAPDQGATLLILWLHLMAILTKVLLMPLSFASMLGGMCTLIGTSTNLVLNAQVLLHNFLRAPTLYFCLPPTTREIAYCLLTRADRGRPGCAAAAPYHVLDERGGPARGAGGHALPRAAIGSGLGLGLARARVTDHLRGQP